MNNEGKLYDLILRFLDGNFRGYISIFFCNFHANRKWQYSNNYLSYRCSRVFSINDISDLQMYHWVNQKEYVQVEI